MSKSALKAERERRGWTLDHVAREVGVSPAQISRIESDGVRAAETAQLIAKLFGNLTLDQICAAAPVEAPESTPSEAVA